MKRIKAFLRSLRLKKTVKYVKFKIEFNNLKARVEKYYTDNNLIPFRKRENEIEEYRNGIIFYSNGRIEKKDP